MPGTLRPRYTRPLEPQALMQRPARESLHVSGGLAIRLRDWTDTGASPCRVRGFSLRRVSVPGRPGEFHYVPDMSLGKRSRVDAQRREEARREAFQVKSRHHS